MISSFPVPRGKASCTQAVLVWPDLLWLRLEGSDLAILDTAAFIYKGVEAPRIS